MIRELSIASQVHGQL